MEDLYCYTVTVKLSADEKVMNEVEAKKLKLWERRCEMIKVIASDMDGTLLNNNHVFSEKTIQSIKKACEKGFRFMVVTGRNFVSAMQPLKDTGLVCDYIVSSGAVIRNPKQEIIESIVMGFDECEYLYNKLKEYPLGILFCSEEMNHILGTHEEVDECILDYVKFFHETAGREELRKTKIYQQMWERTKELPDYAALRENNVPISKMFLFSEDVEMLQEIKTELNKNKNLAVSSSLNTNLEVTHVRAQKGPILKRYIESLGYTMDEVMVLGDSLNDYSMMEMDFGATIAMENAEQEIESVAKYITKSNEEDGVAYVIDEMMKMYGME